MTQRIVLIPSVDESNIIKQYCRTYMILSVIPTYSEED